MSATEVTRQCGIVSSTWRAIAGSKIVTTSGRSASRWRTSSAIRSGKASSRAATQTTSGAPLGDRRAHPGVVGVAQPVDLARRPRRAPRTPLRRGRRRPSAARASRSRTLYRCGEISARHRTPDGCLAAAVRNTLTAQRGSDERGQDGDWKASRCGERDNGHDGARGRRGSEHGLGGSAEGRRRCPARWPRRRPSPRRRYRRSSTACPSPSSRPRRPTGSRGEVWVESNFDTDGDGKLDRMHADYTLPEGDADRRAQGPGHLRGQPVLRGHRRRAQLGRRPRARLPAAARASRAVLQRHQHEPEHLQRATRPPGSRAASASCTPSRPAPATPTAARPPARQRDARRDRRHRLAQRPPQGLHDPHRHRRGRRPSTGTTARPR